MKKSNELKGLETFSIGIILLAGTSFLVYLDMGLMLAFIYRLINVLALCVMAWGIFSLADYDPAFARAKILIILDLILTVAAAGLILFDYAGRYFAINYILLFCSLGMIALGMAVIFTVVRGCGNVAMKKGDEDHRSSCEKTGKMFLALALVGYAALGGVAVLGDAMGGISLFIIIVGGILIVGAHIIMMLRTYETARRFQQPEDL